MSQPEDFLVSCKELPKGTQERSFCFHIGETGLRLCIPESCSVYFDEETQTIQVLADEVNLLPPNVKQRVTNKFYSACKNLRTEEFGTLIPARPFP